MIHRVRLISGLFMFAFVLCHVLNHAAGLGSVTAMAALAPWLTEPWQHPLLALPLTGALFAHWGYAVWSVYRRRSLHLRPWEWVQLLLGMAFPVLMVPHIVSIVGADLLGDAELNYTHVMAQYWVNQPVFGLLQAVALVVAWTHGCIGLHFWLRVKPGYERWRPWLGSAAILIPTVSLCGFAAAGIDLRAEIAAEPAVLTAIAQSSGLTAALMDQLQQAMLWGVGLVAAGNAAPFLVRWVRDTGLARRSQPALTLPDRRRLRIANGASVLEVLRNNGVRVASVCGGRGRCTTCRIQVVAGISSLPEADAVEKRALDRIQAPAGLRLACQLRPTADLTVMPLLPPTATAAEGRRPGGLEGREQRITAMFIDLRGSTKLGESKMPYDVLFILNQFFAEMTQAIHGTRGHYAQFNGDGLLALYGLTGTAEDGARDAVRGAAEMLLRLDRLNETLRSELAAPLRMGIGVHAGDAIVGAMGPPRAQTITAIGDTINTAARLESLTKEHGVSVVLSSEVVRWAGLDLAAEEVHSTVVRGRSTTVQYFALQAAPAMVA
jgi:adenylate cyclase